MILKHVIDVINPWNNEVTSTNVTLTDKGFIVKVDTTNVLLAAFVEKAKILGLTVEPTYVVNDSIIVIGLSGNKYDISKIESGTNVFTREKIYSLKTDFIKVMSNLKEYADIKQPSITDDDFVLVGSYATDTHDIDYAIAGTRKKPVVKEQKACIYDTFVKIGYELYPIQKLNNTSIVIINDKVYTIKSSWGTKYLSEVK